MDQSRRGVSLLACCALGLAWLGSCLAAYQYTERWAVQRALNERKQIASLGPGETVPGLREKRDRRASHKADMIRLWAAVHVMRKDRWGICHGKIEVTEVLESTSRVRVVRQIDARDPIRRGDVILNPLYRRPAESARRPLRLAFAGRFPTFEPHRAEVSRRLAQMGVLVQERLDHWTDVLVVEKDFEQEPDFRRGAHDLHVTVITVATLRSYLSY